MVSVGDEGSKGEVVRCGRKREGTLHVALPQIEWIAGCPGDHASCPSCGQRYEWSHPTEGLVHGVLWFLVGIDPSGATQGEDAERSSYKVMSHSQIGDEEGRIGKRITAQRAAEATKQGPEPVLLDVHPGASDQP